MINPSHDPNGAQITVEQVARRYEKLMEYVGWTDEDAARVQQVGRLVRKSFDNLIEDFYQQILLEPEARQVITGGEEQIARLKATLRGWLEELFSGNYDRGYLERRWRVGRRHVEIGLMQVYTCAAFARLRAGILGVISANWLGEQGELGLLLRSFGLRMDLDLAIIEEAYATEYVTRKTRIERQRGEAVFRKLVESSGCMIVILREDYSIAYFSSFAEELSGYSATEADGRDYVQFMVPELERESVRQEMRRLFQGNAPTRGYEYPIVCRDGSQRWLVWNAQRLDEFEGPPAVLAIGHDITRRKQAEERALQAERLAAIGQMITGLAHESRNAFQRSQACLELLALELEANPDHVELVGRIQRALDHLHHLYEEVRDYAAPIKLDRQICDLRHVWRDSWNHLELTSKDKQIQLKEETGTVDLTCNCDWFAMGQVFRNIFENSITACPTQGRITIRCRRAKFNGATAVCVSICDNGPGIPVEAADRVFEPFFTTKTKGTGLGMAISKRLVEAHGGQITLGDGGPGAEFIIVLPRGIHE